MARRAAILIGVLLVAACGGPPPAAPPAGPPAANATAPPAGPAPAGTGSAPSSAVAVPAGALYACVIERNGAREISTIELGPRVITLCAKNPEMGPCQYAREACRANGGRVFGPEGREITRATEAEYDRRVTRIRLPSN